MAPDTQPSPDPPSVEKPPAGFLTDSEAPIDMRALRAYRLGRVRRELAARDYAGLLLFDPINVRYATGTRNMTV